MDNNLIHFIDVNQLRVGLYIHLDLGWMDHPFTLSNFKVKDEDQINKIRKIGLKKLRYDPNRSDCDPLPQNTIPDSAVKGKTISDKAEAKETVSVVLTDEEKAEAEKKKRHTERLTMLHKALDDNEKKFVATSNNAKHVLKNIVSNPKESIEEAQELINEMVECAYTESEIAIHAVNGNRSTDHHFVHPLNVTVLSMMMAKSIEISEKEARMLGMAALLHDIGKAEIPDKILMKSDELTKSEQSFYEEHCEIGARMALEYGMPKRLATIISQHHEFADGSGYPKRLLNDQIDPLARLLCLVNGFDNLCNPKVPSKAMTPYAALAHLFANQRSQYDETLLRRMIKSLGVYPPGSIVQLSNGMHGIVVSVNPNNPLRPYVMMHNPLHDREQPDILDLREDPTMTIVTCLRPIQLPPDALAYLSPRRKLSYFLDKDFIEKI